WRQAWAKRTIIPLGSLLAIWGAVSAYKSAGADDLRTNIYQPLYLDLQTIDEAAQAASPEKQPLTPKLNELKKTGALARIPVTIQTRLGKVSERSGSLHVAVLAVHESLIREMSSRITQIRTEEMDRAWQEKTSQRLRELSKSGKGISDSATFTMNHSGRSR